VMLTPTNSFLFWGVVTSATFGENQSRNATVRVRTDRRTFTRCDKDTFIVCLVLCAIAMGQIIRPQATEDVTFSQHS